LGSFFDFVARTGEWLPEQGLGAGPGVWAGIGVRPAISLLCAERGNTLQKPEKEYEGATDQ
jgi:hypothetical protein